jgi:hypothetical protein
MVDKQKRFAEGTSVPVNKTRDELEQLLTKHGAAQRMIVVDDAQGRVRVQFSMQGRMVRLDMYTKPEGLPDPKRHSYDQKADTPKGWSSWSTPRRQEWLDGRCEQFAREAWRRLLLITKAQLEIVSDGSRSLEEVFMAHILLPDGGTVGDRLKEQLADSYATGNMPKLLGSGS